MVRVYVGWNAIQPQPPVNGHYRWDAKTLGQLDHEVAALRRRHVNVLIDFHQFHWSPYFAQATCKAGKSVCRASGVPAWFYAGGRFPDTKRGESACPGRVLDDRGVALPGLLRGLRQR